MTGRLAALHDPAHKVAKEIHALRKLGKSVRGGMVLLGMPADDLHEVSAVGRLLGGARDAVSRRTTWRRLAREDGPLANEPAAMAVAAMLDLQAKSATRRPPQEALDWAGARLRHARLALNGIPSAELPARLAEGREHLAKRLSKKLKRLERGKRKADDFHSARKALKAWLGALDHLGESPLPGTIAMADLLGDINDLHTLGKWLHDHGFSASLASEPWHALREKLKALEASALEQAADVRALIG
jgi:hypothetical protein